LHGWKALGRHGHRTGSVADECARSGSTAADRHPRRTRSLSRAVAHPTATECKRRLSCGRTRQWQRAAWQRVLFTRCGLCGDEEATTRSRRRPEGAAPRAGVCVSESRGGGGVGSGDGGATSSTARTATTDGPPCNRAAIVGGWYQPDESRFRKPFFWQAFDGRSPDERVFVCPFVSLSCVRFVCVSCGRTFGHIDQAG